MILFFPEKIPKKKSLIDSLKSLVYSIEKIPKIVRSNLDFGSGFSGKSAIWWQMARFPFVPPYMSFIYTFYAVAIVIVWDIINVIAFCRSSCTNQFNNSNNDESDDNDKTTPRSHLVHTQISDQRLFLAGRRLINHLHAEKLIPIIDYRQSKKKKTNIPFSVSVLLVGVYQSSVELRFIRSSQRCEWAEFEISACNRSSSVHGHRVHLCIFPWKLNESSNFRIWLMSIHICQLPSFRSERNRLSSN